MSPETPECLACGSHDNSLWAEARDLEYFTTPDTFRYYRCLDCDCLFIEPVPADRLAEIYPPNYYSFTGGRRSLVDRVKEFLDRRLFRKILKNIPGETLSVLDVGGGTGWLVGLARSVDSRIRFTQVVDIDPRAESRARAAGHEYFRGRIEDFKCQRRFDFVIMLNLIEHVADPVAVLRNIRGLLAPSAIVLVKTPNWKSLDASLYRHRNWGGFHCPRHFVLFTARGFRRIAAEAGLKVEHLSYTQGAPFWTWSLLFALSRRKLIRIDRDRPVMLHPLAPLAGAAFAALDFIRRPFCKTSQMFITLRPLPEPRD